MDTAEFKGALRILVVDNDVDRADELVGPLEQWGFVAHVAYSASAARMLAEDFFPHVFLINLAMPRQAAFRLADRLRRDDQFQHAMLIGLATGRPRKSALAVFDHVLPLPVDPDAIHHLLAQAQGSSA
jgi:CheY-like chemotaxis protein